METDLLRPFAETVNRTVWLLRCMHVWIFNDGILNVVANAKCFRVEDVYIYPVSRRSAGLIFIHDHIVQTFSC